IRPGILWVVDLGAEEGLGDARATHQGGRRHEDVDAETRNVRVPDRFAHVGRREPAADAELAADRLADPRAVEGAGERIRDRVRDRPVVLVAGVEWRCALGPTPAGRTDPAPR